MVELPLRKPELQAVFAAVGSEARLREILLAFYQLMASDTLIGFFFAGKDLPMIANRQAEFLLRAFGERESYSGKPPAQAHTELAPILVGHFDRRLVLLREILGRFSIPEREIETWVKFENAFRDSIVSA